MAALTNREPRDDRTTQTVISTRSIDRDCPDTYLGGKRTSTTIDKKNERRRPRVTRVLAFWVSFGHIHERVTKLVVSVVDTLCNLSSVGRDTKHGFFVVISIWLGE